MPKLSEYCAHARIMFSGHVPRATVPAPPHRTPVYQCSTVISSAHFTVCNYCPRNYAAVR